MTWTRPQRFIPGTFLRPCDLCGIRYRANELRRGEDGFWRCTKYCVEIPALTRDKISAESQRRREAPPPPHGVPYSSQRTYEVEEKVFDFLAVRRVQDALWPGGSRYGVAPASSAAFNAEGGFSVAQVSNGLSLAASAGEPLCYLCGIVSEGKRPARWITAANTKIADLCSFLISQQFGFGFSATTKSTDAMWGGFAQSGQTLATEDAASCGLGLLLAYRLTSNAAYLTSAQAVASYLRNVQAEGAYKTTGFTSSDAGGTVRLYTGGLSNTCQTTAKTYSHKFYPSSLRVLEFWRELLSTAGDSLYGADTTVSGFYTSAPQKLLSGCIADLRAFWTVGTFDVFSGTTLTGLSATTPREFFNAYPTGTGSWEYSDGNASVGTQITGLNFAMALRSLYQYEGYSTQVSSVFTWLMTFGVNAAFVAPLGTLATDFACASTLLAANSPAQGSPTAGNVTYPAYDPTIALATALQVKPVRQNATALYDWQTTGLMAAIYSTQNASSFKRAKDKIAEGRLQFPVTFSKPAGPMNDWIALRGTSGLAFQLGTPTGGNLYTWPTAAAARVGNVFRYQPQAWTGTNPPALQPGVNA